MNVCANSGAKNAVFGKSGIGLAFGTAEEVDCSSYNGTKTSSAAASAGSIGPNKSGGERFAGVESGGKAITALVIFVMVGLVV